jgi:hypothetical protein
MAAVTRHSMPDSQGWGPVMLLISYRNPYDTWGKHQHPHCSVQPAVCLVQTGILHQHTNFQLPVTIHSKVGDWIDPIDFFGYEDYVPH